eukprot:5745534-Prymnesium_polylepis.2
MIWGAYKWPSSPIITSKLVCCRAALTSFLHGCPTSAMTFPRSPVPRHGFGHSSEFSSRRGSVILPRSSSRSTRFNRALSASKCDAETVG